MVAEQWARLAQLFVGRRVLVLFDSAYQGYASGDLDADAAAVRLFEKAGLLPVVSQSYAKTYPHPCPCPCPYPYPDPDPDP